MSTALEQGIRFFTRETGILSALAAACGTEDRTVTAMDGECADTSVFDLASVTKLFTGLCLMKLKEDGMLDFSRPVSFYDPRFENLRDVPVDHLAKFALTLKTPARLDACGSREEAQAALFAAAPAETPDRRIYSDIPAMILKYVIEAAGGLPLMECVRQVVLDPAGMRETWAKVPAGRLADCRIYSPEYRIENGRRTVRTVEPGIPHDPKAAVLQGGTGDLCGHAGLFSTLADMERFCRAVLAQKIVGEESLREIAVNRTGHLREDGTYTQYLGIQCYVRHPVQYWSEIPVYMGSSAFGIGGFTGNHVSMDPKRNRFTIFLGNRVKGRLTVLVPEAGKTLTDYGLNADGSGTYPWEEGLILPSSVKYVHQKDAHLHTAVMETMGFGEIPFGEE